MRAYDASGEMLMHLQATIDYDVFARALSIGPETMVMNFRPDEPMHNRYAVSHGFLAPARRAGDGGHQPDRQCPVQLGVQLCEMLVKGDEVYPIDYANACPDVAVTSLHYYFPWAIKALVRWSTYCLVTGRRSRTVGLETWRYFDVADREDLSDEEKLDAYLAIADEYFETTGPLRGACTVISMLPSSGSGRGVPPDAADHGRPDLPRARAGPLHGALRGPARPVGPRRGDGWPPNASRMPLSWLCCPRDPRPVG